MATGLQVLNIDVQLMILDVVWGVDHLYLVMFLMSKHSWGERRQDRCSMLH